MARLLVVDDKANIRKVLRIILEKEGHTVETASSGREGLSKALAQDPEVIISDIRMEDMDGNELFHLLRSRGSNTPFIFITAFATVRGAVSAIKQGAVEYLAKPIDYGLLKKTIASLIRQKSRPAPSAMDAVLVGTSPAMGALAERIRAVGGTSSTVLIVGESGAGKELVARQIHVLSSRRDKPFVPVNCSALSMSLLESELFGYERGAFTGAEKQKKGVFEFADGGSLFLDEVSEIDPAIQVKLLRVLQERCFTRVGGTRPVKVDVRLIAATNRRLEELIERGQFRRDLYYRLNVIPVRVPPLREHLEDLTELVEHFCTQICTREQFPEPSVSAGFIERLGLYPWPGNVRELENLIERILVLHRPRRLEARHIDIELTAAGSSLSGNMSERDRILGALRLTQGNKTEAAKVLGLPRRTLYNKIERFGIQKEEYTAV
ncbi:MAG: sigma-54-dependent Fis family transcriptional regulator [Spirochaetales bacterium]|nr:sigma-54-dependent Fis family transcriptional regulator [Spirochaetales bacterium]